MSKSRARTFLSGLVYGLRVCAVFVFITLPYEVYLSWRLLNEVSGFRGTCPGWMDSPAHECSVAEYLSYEMAGLGFARVALEWVVWSAIALAVWVGWRQVMKKVTKVAGDGDGSE